MNRTLFLIVTVALIVPLSAQEIRPNDQKFPPNLGLRVLQQAKVQSGGRTVTVNRVAPPALRAKPAPAEPPVPTPLELAAAERRAGKEQRLLFLSATVIDREVTALRWFTEGREYRAFSNLDFNFLRGLLEFETAEAVYSLFFGFGEDTRETFEAEARGKIPTSADFSPARSEYALAGDRPAPESDPSLAGLDALHAYFDAHRAALIAAWEKREAERFAHERWMQDHPPEPPPPLVIHFWLGKNTVIFDAPATGGKP